VDFTLRVRSLWTHFVSLMQKGEYRGKRERGEREEDNFDKDLGGNSLCRWWDKGKLFKTVKKKRPEVKAGGGNSGG